MPREAELSNNEREFILQALREGIRVDGRKFDAYRDLELEFGDQYGAVDLRLGKTRYVLRICGNVTRSDRDRIAVRLSCDVVAPYPERKFEGVFNIICEFSPMASPAFESGR
jgi:exosome complex component RRP45